MELELTLEDNTKLIVQFSERIPVKVRVPYGFFSKEIVEFWRGSEVNIGSDILLSNIENNELTQRFVAVVKIREYLRGTQ